MAIKIYIDQGHNPTGSPNTGASWYGQQEQDITYEVGQYLAQLLRQDGRFEVRLSRPTASTVLHANASENRQANGTEVYVYRLYTQANWLAQHVLQGIVDTVGTKDNGVRARTNLYVLRRTAMPAILVELGYMSNPQDAEKLRRDRYQFALGIYRGMLRYFGLS